MCPKQWVLISESEKDRKIGSNDDDNKIIDHVTIIIVSVDD